MTDSEVDSHEVEHREPDHGASPSPPPVPASQGVRYASPGPGSGDASQQVRTPFLAAFFSLFPGLGNVYNGLYMRGITFFLVIVGLMVLADETRPPEVGLLIFSVIFTWLFSIFDAYRQATLINLGYTPEQEPAPRLSSWSSGGLTAGIVVFLLGLYGFLREHFDIRLTLLFESWYVLFMAFGAFLIARTVMQRKQAQEAAIEGEGADL